ncbi:TonB-dependent receptor plug domain-containing protein [Tenacibaculum sp.]|nr:TonB-dependent receptor plug domain-containing protein [Tenacibaculum sp.]
MYGQTTISGKVYDEYLETFSGAIVKTDTEKTITDAEGSFTLKTDKSFPFSITVRAFGYKMEIIEISSKEQEINVILKENIALDEVVVSASRSPERVIESPVTIERMGIRDIKKSSSVSFYDGLTNLKGIDSREGSYGFKSINARGFSTFDNTRFVQLVDGVDTSVPALNFSLGNFVGMSELDVENIEILPGAASALYGANAFNGILIMKSKSPFKYSGISTYVKTGVLSQGNEIDNEVFYDAGIRMAYKFSDKFAAKANLTGFSAEEWHATDYRNISRVGGVIIDGEKGDSNYNGLNKYGDEGGQNIGAFIGAPVPIMVNRTGYNESDLTDYKNTNVKFNGSLYYRPWGNDKFEIIWDSRYTQGNTVYQGNSRFSQKNASLQQHKLELRGKNFFVRGYRTANDSGDAYDIGFAGIRINEKYNPSQNWYREYVGVFSGLVTIPGLTPGNHANARAFADRNRFSPNSPGFKHAFSQVVNTPINEGGAAIVDQTSFYNIDANYNFRDLIKWGEIQIGGAYRKFKVNSNGTLFTDKNDKIAFDELGIYTQLQKKFLENRLKLTASIRYDKSKNFEARYSPRISFGYSLGESKNHVVRASYQKAFRNPSVIEQYFGFRVTPNRFVVGTAKDNLDRPIADDVTTTARDILAAGNLNPIKPETVTAFEIGYRSIVNLSENQLLELDINSFYNRYNNFVASKNVVVGTNSFQTYTNSIAEVSSYGATIGVHTKIFKTFDIGGNYTFNKLSFDESQDPDFRPGFNTPEHQIKLQFGNEKLFDNFGFNINARWQDEFLWESSFINGVVNARTVLDAQINYRVPSIKSRFKLGGTNLTKEKYTAAPGSGTIGSIYYLSWTIND